MKAENIFAWLRALSHPDLALAAGGLALATLLFREVDYQTLRLSIGLRELARRTGRPYGTLRRWRQELLDAGMVIAVEGGGMELAIPAELSTADHAPRAHQRAHRTGVPCSPASTQNRRAVLTSEHGGCSYMDTPPAPPNKVSASFSASEKKEKKREEIRERGTTADTPEDPTPHAPPTPHAAPSPPPVLSKGRGQQEAQTEESVEALQIKREGALARMAPTHRVTLLEGRTDVLSASERMPRSQVLAIWEESTGVAWGRWSTAPIWRADALRWLAVVRVTLREDEWRRVCTLAGSKEAGDRVPLSWLTKAVNGVLGERRGRGAWRDHGSYTTTSTFSLVDERTEEQRARDMAAGRAILAEMEAMLSAPGPMLGAGREEVRV